MYVVRSACLAAHRPTWCAVAVGCHRYSTSHLAIAAADGSDAAKGGRVLTRSLDRNLGAAKFGAGGDCVYATMTDNGCSHLCKISLSGGGNECEVTRVIAGEVSVSSWRMSQNGNTVVALMATCAHPAEIFVLDGCLDCTAAQKGASAIPPRRVTHVNDALLS
eukprot:COSAG01_NODE_10709_length_2097_cov_1.943443_3_plen_162_part_01